jgi:PIN like domain
VITLAEHYGVPADEQVADTDWIEEAAKRGWPILMKDKRIRHRRAEITAVTEQGFFVAEVEFDFPAPQVGLQNFLR